MSIRISGSIAIRENGPLMLGDCVPNHPHNFPHTTMCPLGALRLRWINPDGTVGSILLKSPRPGYDGPSMYLVPAHVWHSITAEEDHSLSWCAYSHRDESGKIVQHFEGNSDAYGTVLGERDMPPGLISKHI